MTTGFTIDDVRDTLTADVTRFLGRIEATAREILENKNLGSDAAPSGVPLFEAIGDHGHAIYGTSCLVAADSLSSSAHALEALALRGRDELAKAARHLARAREIAMALVSGSSDMLAMLSLELEHRPEEAGTVANGWRMRAEEVLMAPRSQAGVAIARAAATPVESRPVPRAKSPTEEKWSFDEGWSVGAQAGTRVAPPPSIAVDEADGFSFATSVAELPVDLETGAIDAELAEIFEAEARQTLTSLADQLTKLAAVPGDRKLCHDLERSYHTLKGAAATVGLAAVSERAAELQHRVESLVEGGGPASEAFITELIRDTELLRRSAGLRPSSAASVVSVAVPRWAASEASAAIGAEVRAEFEHEARALLEEGEHLLANIADAESGAVAGQLARIFHRVRGSALVANAAEIAGEAARLEEVCRSGSVDSSSLGAGIGRCLELLSSLASPSLPSGSSPADETRMVFLDEARALHGEAAGLAGQLAAASSNPGDVREGLRRLMHRLKGSALVVADEAVAREAKALLDSLTTGDPAPLSSIGDRLARIASLLGVGGSSRSADGDARRQRLAVTVPDPELEAGFQQECGELLDTLERGVLALEHSERPTEQLQAILRSYHTLKGVVNTIGLDPTGALVHQIEDFLEALRIAPIMPPLRGVVSLLLQSNGEIRRHLKTARHGYVEVAPGRFGHWAGKLLAGESRATVSGQSRSGSRSGGRFGEGSEVSGASGATDGPDRKSIRVPIERLDALMNLAGELVISRSRLLSRIESLRSLQGDLGRSNKRLVDVVETFRDEHEFSSMARVPRVAAAAARGQWGAFSELEMDRYEDVNILARSLAESSTDAQELFGQLGHGLSSLVDDSDAFGTIIAGLQSQVTEARMVPLGSVFSRLQLPVRDAAQRERREVRLVTEGDDVHLDKTIVDALFQPLLHLVRNAVSHGLETAERRSAAGKPATGLIALRARQELGQIVIHLSDDGAGLDLERLHARGVAMGLIGAEVTQDDPKVKDLVFAPGLSTQASVGQVAGRGVGCDVVRRAVERLNGSVRVETVRGQGATFVVTLPLTLAISRALLVRHAGHTFAVPLYFTERIIDVQDHEVVTSAGQRRIEVDDAFVPVRRMGEFVTIPDVTCNDLGPILLLRVGDQRLVVQVDAVVGQEEIVVKGLGAVLTGHPMFAGVTIRGTGDIVLILDVPSLIYGGDGKARRTPQRRPGGRDARPAQPLAGDQVPAAEGGALDPALASAAGGPMRVLFVDDSVSVRKVAERTLRAMGVDVTLAVDGVDALDKLHNATFDLVFTDLEMPRMHGYELIRELRFLPAYSALPIVVVTSRSGKKHRDEARSVGASDYLTKPFSARSLEAALVKLGGARARTLQRSTPEGAPVIEEGTS